MLKENVSVLRKLLIFFDFCVASAAFCLGYMLRNNIRPLEPFSHYTGLVPIFAVLWLMLLSAFEMYNSFRTKKISEIIMITLRSFLVGFFILSSVIYLLKLEFVSRSMIGLSFICAFLLIIIEKILLISFFRQIRKKGYNYRNILIVGTGRRAQNFMSLIERHSEWGLKIIGLVDEDPAKKGEEIRGYRVLGAFQDVPDIIHNNVVDDIVFVVPRSWLDRIEELMLFCESEGIKIHLAVDYFDLKISRAKQTELHGFPLLTFESTTDKVWHLFIKRTFDALFSGFVLIILLPFFVVIGIIIKLTSKGPVFFKQLRCGLNGRKFTLFKFRTMVRDAEAKLADLRQHNEMDGPVFKMKDDPRLTPIGKFLRKFSIDEFPQLWNVFRGDMSLIGPRPPLPNEVEKYNYWQRRRLSMKPGLSCLWQVSGRNKITDFEEWIRLDFEYIDNWSLWLDIKIFLKTIPVVLFGIGAK